MVSKFFFVYRGQTWSIRCCYSLSSLPKRLSAQNEFLLRLHDKIGANGFQNKVRSKGLTMLCFDLQANPSMVPSKDGYQNSSVSTLPFVFFSPFILTSTFSTMPNVVTGEGPSWTFKAPFFSRWDYERWLGLGEGWFGKERNRKHYEQKNTCRGEIIRSETRFPCTPHVLRKTYGTCISAWHFWLKF